jgi:hypothetical protein
VTTIRQRKSAAAWSKKAFHKGRSGSLTIWIVSNPQTNACNRQGPIASSLSETDMPERQYTAKKANFQIWSPTSTCRLTNSAQNAAFIKQKFERESTLWVGNHPLPDGGFAVCLSSPLWPTYPYAQTRSFPACPSSCFPVICLSVAGSELGDGGLTIRFALSHSGSDCSFTLRLKCEQ